MTRDEFNTAVQGTQRFCLSAGLEWRTAEIRDSKGYLTCAHFEVFYGHWRTLGYHHRPFQPDARYEWDDIEAELFKLYVVDDVAKS